MNLYKVVATVEVIFYQAEEPDSREVADAVHNEGTYLSIDSFSVTKIDSLNDVPKSWHKSFPYGDNDGSETVAELLTKEPKTI